MRFGTPTSDYTISVMVLGSGELGKEVIISLQRLGVEVIADDRYRNVPGHQVAYRSHVIDMTDGESLEKLINQENPDLVITEIEAIITKTLIALESSGKISVVTNARSLDLTMNREGIRRLAREKLLLPTSNYRFTNNLEELKRACSDIGYPCIIRPIMSSSGEG